MQDFNLWRIHFSHAASAANSIFLLSPAIFPWPEIFLPFLPTVTLPYKYRKIRRIPLFFQKSVLQYLY